MESFNVNTNTWTTSPITLPAATCGLAAAVDPNGLFYAIGGDTPVGTTPTVTAKVYSYNPAAPGWTSAPALPSARAALAAVTGPDGLIYALGGADGSSTTWPTVQAFTTDKCYAIAHKIAVVQRSILIEAASIAELPLTKSEARHVALQLHKLFGELQRLSADPLFAARLEGAIADYVERISGKYLLSQQETSRLAQIAGEWASRQFGEAVGANSIEPTA